jgi:BlaI family penicillinase repressor
MRVLWEHSPLSAAEVIDAVAPAAGWKPQTVKTLLSRLVEKRALAFEKSGKAYLYRPLVDRSACTLSESTGFLQRVFDGLLTPMVANLVESRRLSKREIDELRDLLDKAQPPHAPHPSQSTQPRREGRRS